MHIFKKHEFIVCLQETMHICFLSNYQFLWFFVLQGTGRDLNFERLENNFELSGEKIQKSSFWDVPMMSHFTDWNLTEVLLQKKFEVVLFEALKKGNG